jgi:hypothetical protein
VSARALCLFGGYDDQPETSGAQISLKDLAGDYAPANRGDVVRPLHGSPNSRETVAILGHTCVPHKDIVSQIEKSFNNRNIRYVIRDCYGNDCFMLNDMLPLWTRDCCFQRLPVWRMAALRLVSNRECTRTTRERGRAPYLLYNQNVDGISVPEPPTSRFCLLYMFMQCDGLEIG